MATWLPGGYTKRIMLTLANSRATDIASPVACIKITNSASSGITATDLSDIVNTLGPSKYNMAITRSNGVSKCYLEIAYWDYTNKIATIFFNTGETITAGTVKTYYIYWGADADADLTYIGVPGSAVTKNYVWSDTLYKNIWHCNQSPSLSGSPILDSTSSSNDLQCGDGYTESTIPTLIDGPLGKALSFDGVNDYLHGISQSTAAYGQVVIEAYFSLTAAAPVGTTTTNVAPILFWDTAYIDTFLSFDSAGSQTICKLRDYGGTSEEADALTLGTFYYFGSQSIWTGSAPDNTGRERSYYVKYDTAGGLTVGGTAATIKNTSQYQYVGPMYIGGKSGSALKYLNFTLQELRISHHGSATGVSVRSTDFLTFSALSLADKMISYYAVENTNVNGSSMTIVPTAAGEGGACAQSAGVVMSADGQGSAEATANIAVTVFASGGWHGWSKTGDLQITPTLTGISYPRGYGLFAIPRMTISAYGMPHPVGSARVSFKAFDVFGHGGGHIDMHFSSMDCSAAGHVGQAAHGSIIFPAMAVSGKSGGGTIAPVGFKNLTLVSTGKVGSVGHELFPVGIAITSSGKVGALGRAEISFHDPDIIAHATMQIVGISHIAIPIEIAGEGITGLNGRAAIALLRLDLSAAGKHGIVGSGVTDFTFSIIGTGTQAADLYETYIIKYAR